MSIIPIPTAGTYSCSIRYLPSNALHFESSSTDVLPSFLAQIHHHFNEDWRGGWFRMAADKVDVSHHPLLRFWQEIASHHLTSLCHIPPETESLQILPPHPELLHEWTLRMPPMVGGEYLSSDRVLSLWQHLHTWCLESMEKHGGLQNFLSAYAPLWQQVGRVCFHLAENKKDENRPFAFLATYSTGFGSNGKLKHLPLKEALTQYSGSNNRQALIKLLTPVQRASEKCPWVQELMETSEIYQPLAWAPQQAYKFLCTIPQLEDSGLSVRIPNWWKQRPRPQVSVTIGSSKQSALNANALLDFNVGLAIGDQQLSEKELQEIMAKGQSLVFMRGQWIEVDRERLQEALDHWKHVQKGSKDGSISFIDGMRMLAGVPSSLEQTNDSDRSADWVRVVPGNAMQELLQKMRHPDISSSRNLSGLNAELRPYQHEGINWLALLSGLGLGACLADDMGLGKTIQILALLLIKQQQKLNRSNKVPSLLIVPASLMGNWQREAGKFTPTLKLFLLHPSEVKDATLSEIEKSPTAFFEGKDLVITTYSMLTRLPWLYQISWDLLILDEAQAIKNSGTKQTKAVKDLQAQSRIALTGTPIENHLSDLWSLFDFLNKGLLGSPKDFKAYISYLQSHPNKFESLRKLTAPYILRRMKTDSKIISDLPDKIETAAYCSLTPHQVHHYQHVVEELRTLLENADSKARRGIVLRALLQLKQICNHPAQYQSDTNYTPAYSGKFGRLGEICEELASRQEKVLIFTQFSEIITPLQNHLEQIFGRKGLTLDGGTPIKERKALVDQFQQSDGPPFFILSLRAGGTGLTLTEASHVIHFDRWWNPSVENQATDRAFRIGQKKNVLVHKFITLGTVEEKIDLIISSKQQLANEILAAGDEVNITELSDEALLNLISLDLNKATAT